MTDVPVYAGDDILLKVTVKKPDGTPKDMTGGTARWWLGKRSNSVGSEVYLKKDTTTGGCTMALDSGFWVVSVPIAHLDTKGLAPRSYYHEVEVEDSAGKVSTVFGGKFVVSPTLIASQV